MKTCEKQRKYQSQNRGQAQQEVFNLVGELLSISFEKYDVEMVIESDKSLKKSGDNAFGTNGLMKTVIDCEDIVETKTKLEVFFSGTVSDQFDYEENFMFFFSLHYTPENNTASTSGYSDGNGINSINMKIGRKIEQLSDPVFSINWVCEDFYGKKVVLGRGRGILIFSNDKECKAN